MISAGAARAAAIRERWPDAFAPAPGGRRAAVLAAAGIGLLLVVAAWRLDLRFSWRGADRLAGLVSDMFPPRPNGALLELVAALLQSIGMAFMGTLLASVAAALLCVFGARDVVASRAVRFVFRRQWDFLRGVDVLIWALVYVRAVGLGPLAGVLAIATSDTGTLAKLFAENIEHAGRRQSEAVRAAGANGLQTVRLGVLPQVLPVMLANVLYMFESNTRSATILGIVGAGGIGFQLADRIRAHRWDEAAFIIVMIGVAVALIDVVSHALRKRLAER